MEAAASARADVYMRIGAQRNCSVAEIRETKSPKGIELARSAKRIEDPRSEFHTSMFFRKVMKFSTQIMHS